MLRHLRLLEQQALPAVDATADQSGSHAEDLLSKDMRILWLGHGVQIHDTKDTVLLRVILQSDPLTHGTEIIPQMQSTSRLDAREDDAPVREGSDESVVSRLEVHKYRALGARVEDMMLAMVR